MKRLAKLVSLFWSTSVAAEMEYRLNFIIATLSSLGGLAGALFSLYLFYSKDFKLGGWSWPEALAVLAVFTLLKGLGDTFLDRNLGSIVNHVQMGTLDFVLLKPVDSQFWLSTRLISLWGLPDVLIGLALLIYSASSLGLSGFDLLVALLPLMSGFVILYSLWFVLAATSIWFVKIYNATEVLKHLLEAGRFPISAYPVAWRVVFTYIVPVAFLTTVPAQAFLGQKPWALIGGSCVCAVVLFLASRAFWRFALRFYTSASS